MTTGLIINTKGLCLSNKHTYSNIMSTSIVLHSHAKSFWLHCLLTAMILCHTQNAQWSPTHFNHIADWIHREKAGGGTECMHGGTYCIKAIALLEADTAKSLTKTRKHTPRSATKKGFMHYSEIWPWGINNINHCSHVICVNYSFLLHINI